MRHPRGLSPYQGPPLSSGLDGTADTVCAPDIEVLPARGELRQLGGGERLFMAIIEQAILDHRGTRQQRRRRGLLPSALQAEAEVWLTSGSTDLLSFRWVCDQLGLDPDYIWEQRDRWMPPNRVSDGGNRHQVGGGLRREAA